MRSLRLLGDGREFGFEWKMLPARGRRAALGPFPGGGVVALFLRPPHSFVIRGSLMWVSGFDETWTRPPATVNDRVIMQPFLLNFNVVFRSIEGL